MRKKLIVPKGKDLVSLSVESHSYVRLLDSNGKETFRFDSPGEHVTAVVSPGGYVVDTDGRVRRINLATMERRHRRREFDAMKPPAARPEISP